MDIKWLRLDLQKDWYYASLFLFSYLLKSYILEMLAAEREERFELQKLLKESLSFKEISHRLDRNTTTISREVRKYRSEVAKGYPGYPYNACKNRINCRNKDMCGK